MLNQNDRVVSDGRLPVYALTGAGGHLGRLVLASLLNLVPAKQILATTRQPEQLADFAAQGVVVRHADFNDPSTLPAAFSGATRLLIISTGNYKEIQSGQRIVQHRAAIAAAVNAEVRHITYTSCPNATNADVEDPLIRDHGQTEIALAESGVPWTALRNNVYMAGLPYFLGALRIGDQLLVPEGSIKPCWVTHEDCARTAASVLVGKVAFTGAVDVTGPEALGFADLAQRWSSLQGRKVSAQVLPDKEVIERLVAKGMPLQSAQGIVGNARGMLRLNAVPADTVKRATGKPPTSVDGLLRNLVIA